MIRATIVSMALAFAAAPVAAQFAGPSNTASNAQSATVKDIAMAREGADVILTGNIVNHLREDYYTFRDASGTVRVELDKDVIAGRKLEPDTNIRITGEVEDSSAGRYIDADRLEILP